jgi:hypothetical protein
MILDAAEIVLGVWLDTTVYGNPARNRKKKKLHDELHEEQKIFKQT